jgi:hypothetical protein
VTGGNYVGPRKRCLLGLILNFLFLEAICTCVRLFKATAPPFFIINISRKRDKDGTKSDFSCKRKYASYEYGSNYRNKNSFL